MGYAAESSEHYAAVVDAPTPETRTTPAMCDKHISGRELDDNGSSISTGHRMQNQVTTVSPSSDILEDVKWFVQVLAIMCIPLLLILLCWLQSRFNLSF